MTSLNDSFLPRSTTSCGVTQRKCVLQNREKNNRIRVFVVEAFSSLSLLSITILLSILLVLVRLELGEVRSVGSRVVCLRNDAMRSAPEQIHT